MSKRSVLLVVPLIVATPFTAAPAAAQEAPRAYADSHQRQLVRGGTVALQGPAGDVSPGQTVSDGTGELGVAEPVDHDRNGLLLGSAAIALSCALAFLAFSGRGARKSPPAIPTRRLIEKTLSGPDTRARTPAAR